DALLNVTALAAADHELGVQLDEPLDRVEERLVEDAKPQGHAREVDEIRIGTDGLLAGQLAPLRAQGFPVRRLPIELADMEENALRAIDRERIEEIPEAEQLFAHERLALARFEQRFQIVLVTQGLFAVVNLEVRRPQALGWIAEIQPIE